MEDQECMYGTFSSRSRTHVEMIFLGTLNAAVSLCSFNPMFYGIHTKILGKPDSFSRVDHSSPAVTCNLMMDTF